MKNNGMRLITILLICLVVYLTNVRLDEVIDDLNNTLSIQNEVINEQSRVINNLSKEVGELNQTISEFPK